MNSIQKTTQLQRMVTLHDRLQTQLGHGVAWGALSLVVLAASVVFLRYGFDTGSIALQETVMYNHALFFMLGIAYTLGQNKHVRVDVFYEGMPPKRQAWVDLLGALFLALPTMVFIIWSSWTYIGASWRVLETSAEAGGLDFVYLLKSVILIMAGLVILQILSMAAKAWLNIQSLNLKGGH